MNFLVPDLVDHIKLSNFISLPSFSSFLVFFLFIPFVFVSFYSSDQLYAHSHVYNATELLAVVGSSCLYMTSLILMMVMSLKTVSWAAGPSLNFFMTMVSNFFHLPLFLSKITNTLILNITPTGVNPTRLNKNNNFCHVLCFIFVFFTLVTSAMSEVQKTPETSPAFAGN
jgi:hypothetical protein